MNVAIRVKGDTRLGMGHVYRCMSVADYLREKHPPVKVKFYSMESFPESVLALNGYEHIILHNTSSEEFLDKIGEFKPDIIVYDIQDFKKSDVEPVRKKFPDSRILCFDNLGTARNHVDIAVDANLDEQDNRILKPSKKVKYLLGPEHMVLHSRILNYHPREVEPLAKNIVITMGFTDIHKITARIIDSFRNINLKVDAIAGSIDEDYRKELLRLGHEHFNSNFTLHVKPDNFYEIIQQADIAFSAGGITLYEIAYFGVPAIVLCQADHQVKIARRFHERASVINLGMEYTPEQIRTQFMKLRIDFNLRKIMNDNLRNMVDGHGLARIVKTLIR